MLFDESLALMRATGNATGIARATHRLAHLAVTLGELEPARVAWEESLTLFRELGDQASSALTLLGLGWIAAQFGELERAKALLVESLELGEQVDFALIPVAFLEMMTLVAVRSGESKLAARSLAAADVARAASGEVLEATDRADMQHTAESGCAQIGGAAWDQAWHEGRAMSLQRAVALARAYATNQQHDVKGGATNRDKA